MSQSPDRRVPQAPPEALPVPVVDPPWLREPSGFEGLQPPTAPTVVNLPEWLRDKFMKKAPADKSCTLEEWSVTGGWIRDGTALTERSEYERVNLYTSLVVYGPHHLATEALQDRRYWDELRAKQIRAIVARHGLAAYPLALHDYAIRPWDDNTMGTLAPFLDTEVARRGLCSKKSGLADWCAVHGTAAVPFVLPYALSKPNDKDAPWDQVPHPESAMKTLRKIASLQGIDDLIKAVRPYGPDAVRVIEALRYPAEAPRHQIPLDGLPQVLLRDRQSALPPSAVGHLVTLLLWSTPSDPHKPAQPSPGLEEVIEACDPGSLAEFAWALYACEPEPSHRTGRWASYGVQYALERLGDDETAGRLAEVVVRWSTRQVDGRSGVSALEVFNAIGSDAALYRLGQLAHRATDKARIRPAALDALRRIAKRRGLDDLQLAVRLVPDFGLDPDAGKTLDYGPRAFRVGFDEQLTPYVIDGAGKRRAGLPKPGAVDDPHLATAAREHFAELRKETRAMAADQIGRLENAMMDGRTWTVEEFRATCLDHPLLWHITRRLLWSVDRRPFRIAQDRSLADADDAHFALPSKGAITLPHPIQLGRTLTTWSEIFADHQIDQPFPQLARAVMHLTEQERHSDRLTCFNGAKVPNERLVELTKQGWFWPKRRNARREIVARQIAPRATVGVEFGPGFTVNDPTAPPMQTIEGVALKVGFDLRYSQRPVLFGSLTPAQASDVLASVTDLTS